MTDIGIDIVNLKRITSDPALIQRILTEEEQAEYALLTSDVRRREYLGGHFAAKEAIFKATGDPAWLAYAILHHENGKPFIKGHPELPVSISHDGDMAIAIVWNTGS
jgi:holo-[acyl-carrier protein] synthase